MARVLIIDDSEISCELVRQTLEAAGHEVLQETNSMFASSVVLREAPDVVLMDVKMPGLGGSKVIDLLRKRGIGTRSRMLLFSAMDKKELDEIVAETEKEERKLVKKSQGAERIIEERLLTGYKRIRQNARNGLAVVSVERNACGGCFNKIPPQRQLDIRLHKKVIVCEHCGRILVDPEIDAVKL